MGLPVPPTSLDGSCSVVWGGTLYSYTPSAFLSLKLSEGAEWQKLEIGESVTGGTCVGSTADSANAGFFVIGGTGGTTGLIKYTFSTGKWTAIHPGDSVVKDRLGHSSAYIKSKDSILVFGGGKDGQAGQETFLIKASEPYSVTGFPASAPAALKPILLPWGDSSAFMISGDTNTNVYQFNPDAQTWSYSGSSLAEPVTPQVKGALVTGTDGSENLFLFDLSQTPNRVSRVVIKDANGQAVPSSPYISARDLEDLTANEKRDSVWPTYNSTQAPDYTRENYAIAQGSDGQVYFTGGSSKEPIAIFNPMQNGWVDAQEVLTPEKDTKSAPTSTSTSASATSSSVSSSASSTATSSSSVSSTFTTAISSTASSSTQATGVTTTGVVSTDATSNKQNKSDEGLNSNVVLGISLGSIFAFLLLNDEKDPNAFGNVSPSAPPGYFRGHRANESQDSFSSMAILMGRLNNNVSSGLSRKGSKGSNRSSVSSLHKQLKSTISKPIPQVNVNPIMASSPAPAYGRAVGQERSLTGGQPRAPGMTLAVPEGEEEMRGSSGWDRYWSGGSALQVLGFGQKRSTVVSESSHYSQNSGPNPNQASRVTQDSATVPPLNIEGRASYARVNSGNVIVTGNSHQIPLPGGLSGKIERPVSKASSGYSSGVPESVTDGWEAATGSKPWGTERAPSSAYNSTFSLGGATAQQQEYSSSRPHRSGVSTQPQLAMASKSSDMSWLNIGALDPSRKQ
ncbi:unnamed protein product [Clonostachys rosea f. rosea IK726]|uniref:Uncharacterized protein n=2 Tax=Bionectria ochroleuca TaxID=29856 RepID=A0A0B7JR31_BIOOC|nr:unnamed protein product [Clonostachys rosea f. rosea IK726]